MSAETKKDVLPLPASPDSEPIGLRHERQQSHLIDDGFIPLLPHPSEPAFIYALSIVAAIVLAGALSFLFAKAA